VATAIGNQLSESRIDSTTSTTAMQSIVKTVENIETNYQFRPHNLLVRISQHLSLFNSIRLKDVEWFISNSSDALSGSEAGWSENAATRGRGRSRSRTGKGVFEIAIIKGEFLDFDGNFRFALSAIDDLEDAMRVSGYYDSVSVLKRPLDIESDNQLSGDVSIDGKAQQNSAEFAIRVTRKVKTDEK